VARLDRLDALYSSHHEAKEGFTFGAEERASTIAGLSVALECGSSILAAETAL
jgi:hypothetical protein